MREAATARLRRTPGLGKKKLPVIANQFAGTEVDFKPALSAFAQALAPSKRGSD